MSWNYSPWFIVWIIITFWLWFNVFLSSIFWRDFMSKIRTFIKNVKVRCFFTVPLFIIRINLFYSQMFSITVISFLKFSSLLVAPHSTSWSSFSESIHKHTKRKFGLLVHSIIGHKIFRILIKFLQSIHWLILNFFNKSSWRFVLTCSVWRIPSIGTLYIFNSFVRTFLFQKEAEFIDFLFFLVIGCKSFCFNLLILDFFVDTGQWNWRSTS